MEKSSDQRKIKKIIKSIPSGIKEITYGVSHLPFSFEQKLKIDVEEGKDFLSHLRDVLPEQNPYLTKDEKLPVVCHIASGFYSSCFKFESSTGKWLIKVGHKRSPMKTQYHPSSQEYASSYLQNLNIQRAFLNDVLPYFIPEPQAVFYIQGKYRATTVIIQPFIDYISSFDKKAKLSQEDQQQLGNEFNILKDIVRKMRREYGVMPDFMRAHGKKGHLVVVRKNDGAHLVMLDNGVYDEKSDQTPALHLANKWIAKRSIDKQIKRLKD